MSRYDWESASVILPSKDFATFRRGLIDVMNARTLKTFALAQAVYDRLLLEGKGKRGFAYRDVGAGAYVRSPETDRVFSGVSRASEHDEAIIGGIVRLLYPSDFTREARAAEKPTDRPTRPMKKALRLYPTTAMTLMDGECSVSFDPKSRRVRYHSGDNNHQAERARSSVLGRAFFAALSAIEWTRGSGGEGTGNDEDNRNNCGSGGGGNYTTDSWGPLGGHPVGKKRPLDRFSGRGARY